MATTQNTYTGNGSTTNYSFTFEYLKQSDVKVTLDTVATTAFSFVNATTLGFNTAPGSGVAIRIFRDTAIDNLSSTFFPGSAIKAEDLNNNFTQNLYVTQEADTEVAAANTTASSAVTTANTANTKADNAVSTANTASTNATNAVTTANSATTTANTASTNATTAVTTANTASTNASNAVTTANTASTNATAAVNTANTASTNATAAVNTANTASTNASSAVTTANSATTTANSAVTTANSAVTTANTANTNATSAATSATSAQTSATSAQNSATAAAASAAASANVADAFTATGTPATLLTVDVPIDAANGVKLPTNSDGFDQEGAIRYNTTLDKIEIRKGSGWNTAAGGATVSATPPTLASSGDVWYDHDNGRAYVYYNDGDSNQWVEMNPSWNGYVADNSVTSAKIVDGTIVNTDINGSAAIAGTKIDPNFGNLNVLTTGNLNIGNYDASSNSGQGVIAYASGALNIQRTSGASIDTRFQIRSGNTPVIEMRNDGSADFSGKVKCLGGTTSANALQIGGNNNSAKGIEVYNAGGALNASIKLDGTAYFSGNLLIGTATSNSAKFKVSDGGGYEFAFFPNDSGVNSLINYNRSGSAYVDMSTAAKEVSFKTGTSPTEAVRINSAGRLLVGTTETSVHPDRLIEIGNTTRSGTYQAITTSSSGVGGIVFADTVTNDTGGYRGLIQYFHADDAMVLKTSSVEALRITSDGKVGIGTASADANLHIKGGYPTVHIERDHATNYARLLLDNTANDGGAIDGIGDGVGGLRFSTSDAGTISEKMRLDTSGRLNIGTTSGNAGRPVHIHTAGSGSSYFHSTNDGTGATASDGIVMGMGAAADAYIWNYESGMIQFGTNGGARMTIEGSGFVKAQAGYLYVQNPSVSGTGNADGVALIVDGNADAYLWNYENTTLRFGTNNQEAMRVDSSGRLLISKTASNFAVEGIELRQNGEVVATRDAGDVLTLRRLSSNGTVASFRETNGGVVGTIATTSSSTAYNTSSDYRLKENVVEIADGIARVKQLQPKRFNFIVDPDTTVDGFLAHEAQAVVPEAVTGEKDGEEMQGIDQSKIVPLLTAALQEAITKIETLETKVAQLEANN